MYPYTLLIPIHYTVMWICALQLFKTVYPYTRGKTVYRYTLLIPIHYTVMWICVPYSYISLIKRGSIAYHYTKLHYIIAYVPYSCLKTVYPYTLLTLHYSVMWICVPYSCISLIKRGNIAYHYTKLHYIIAYMYVPYSCLKTVYPYTPFSLYKGEKLCTPTLFWPYTTLLCGYVPYSCISLIKSLYPYTGTRGDWFSADHIMATQKLLRQHFTVSGPQDPAYAEKPSSFTVQGNGSIQIHHNGINHWLTSTCRKGVVKVYDSLWMTNISPSVLLQLGAKYREKARRGSLDVDICHVEHQRGSSDCGLYAVAYATDLANGIDPLKMSYSSEEMRPHFIKCLERSKLIPFPKELKLARAERATRVVTDIL